MRRIAQDRAAAGGRALTAGALARTGLGGDAALGARSRAFFSISRACGRLAAAFSSAVAAFGGGGTTSAGPSTGTGGVADFSATASLAALASSGASGTSRGGGGSITRGSGSGSGGGSDLAVAVSEASAFPAVGAVASGAGAGSGDLLGLQRLERAARDDLDADRIARLLDGARMGRVPGQKRSERAGVQEQRQHRRNLKGDAPAALSRRQNGYDEFAHRFC